MFEQWKWNRGNRESTSPTKTFGPIMPLGRPTTPSAPHATSLQMPTRLSGIKRRRRRMIFSSSSSIRSVMEAAEYSNFTRYALRRRNTGDSMAGRLCFRP